MFAPLQLQHFRLQPTPYVAPPRALRVNLSSLEPIGPRGRLRSRRWRSRPGEDRPGLATALGPNQQPLSSTLSTSSAAALALGFPFLLLRVSRGSGSSYPRQSHRDPPFTRRIVLRRCAAGLNTRTTRDHPPSGKVGGLGRRRSEGWSGGSGGRFSNKNPLYGEFILRAPLAVSFSHNQTRKARDHVELKPRRLGLLDE